MSDSMTTVAARLPDPLLAKLDEYVAKVSRDFPGARYSRSDAVRHLLMKQLAAEGIGSPEPTDNEE